MANTESRRKRSKAEIKAYEARRAAERARVAHRTADNDAGEVVVTTADHTYVMSRDDEYAVVREDLIRLGIIVAVLLAVLIAMTFII